MPRHFWLCRIAALAVCAITLIGCGSSIQSASITPASPATLGGNWLLAGTLPFPFGTPAQSLGAAITFIPNSDGTSLNAALFVNPPCVIGYYNNYLLSGTVASDGTFSLNNPGLPVFVTLTGVVPAANASTWSGHLTLSADAACSTPQSINVTAERIAPVTGTYTAPVTFTSTSLSNPTSQTGTLTFVLQQGNSPSAASLSGSVTVQGISCLTSGTLTPIGSGVSGAEVSIDPTMNDGSTILFIGNIDDTGAQHIFVPSGSRTSGGSCGSFILSSLTLTRQ